MALGVGGAAAAGLESGFNMGLRADEANERRKQNEIENTRRDRVLSDATAERERNNAIQDDDRALQAFTLGLEDDRYTLGALHARYGDAPGGVPETEARPIIDRIAKTHAQRQELLNKRSRPIIEKAQQEARDFSSRMSVGAADPMSLPNAKFNEYILASTGIPASRFVNGEVKAAITDAQAGLETGNYDLVFKAANVLLPEIKQGIGQVAPDGSVIVDKELVGFAPAPMGPPTEGGAAPAPVMANPIQGLTAALTAATSDSPAPVGAGNDPVAAGVQAQTGLQPGSDPDKLLPVLKVTTRQPDGRLTSYNAPITKDRSTDPNAPIANPVSMKALMDRLGQIGVLNEWMQKPEVRAKAEAGAAGAKKTTFEEAWGMVHGDSKALNDDTDPTSKKIKAIQKLAKEQGITFAEAARQFDGKGASGRAGSLQQKLDAIDADEDLTPAEKAKAKRVAYGLVGKAAAVKADEPGVPLSPEAVDQTARAAMNDRSALTGLGRDPKKVTQVLNRMAELSSGGDVSGSRAGYKADVKSLEKMIPQYDAVVAFENNTVKQGKILVDLAKKVDATGIPVVERWIRGGRQAVAGDEDVSAFNAQLMLFGTEAAKILTNPNLTGVLTDSARHEVSEFLPKSASAGQIERVVKLLENDFDIRKKSIEDQVGVITERMAKRVPSTAGVGDRGPATKVDPKAQAARDSDAVGVLKRELADEEARLAQISDPATAARKQADIEAIKRELAKAQGGKGGGTGLSTPSGEKPKAATTFTSEADAAAAFKAGKLKKGDRITIGGQTGTWQ